VLCQVTSKSHGDPNALALDDAGFASGSLRVPSWARPGKLFTASEQLIVGEVGQLTVEARTAILDAVVALDPESPAQSSRAAPAAKTRTFRRLARRSSGWCGCVQGTTKGVETADRGPLVNGR
jgi:hypothetical protein